MKTFTESHREDASRSSAASARVEQKRGSAAQFVNNRPEALQMRKLQEMMNESARVRELKAIQNGLSNSLRVTQFKPIGAETKYLDSPPKQADVFGMRVANVINQDGDEDQKYVVAERIAEVGRDGPFAIEEKKTSEHEFSKVEADEVRVDFHLLSGGAIKTSELSDNHRYYDYTVQQNFVYKENGRDDSSAVVVPNSGFEIKHRLLHLETDGSWVHVTTKVPKTVDVKGRQSAAGTGIAYSNFTALNKSKLWAGRSHVDMNKEPKKNFADEIE
jgi:hypothetical protein